MNRPTKPDETQNATEHSDLPTTFIQEVRHALQEKEAGLLTPYVFATEEEKVKTTDV